MGSGKESANRILVVVDMQNDFVDGALGTKEAEGIVERVAAKIRGFDGKIFATLDTHYSDYLETLEGKKLPVPHCIKATEGWQLNKRIQEALASKECRTIEKRTFGSTDLVDEMQKIAETDDLEIEMVGLCTDICVVSNALLLKVAFPEANLKVDAGCCAGVTPDTHKAALETMKMCQIDII